MILPLPIPEKESEVWWTIGMMLEAHPEILETGLCYASDKIFRWMDMSILRNGNMRSRIYYRASDHVFAKYQNLWLNSNCTPDYISEMGTSSSYAYPRDTPDKDIGARILAAYWMALECEEEEAS